MAYIKDDHIKIRRTIHTSGIPSIIYISCNNSYFMNNKYHLHHCNKYKRLDEILETFVVHFKTFLHSSKA